VQLHLQVRAQSSIDTLTKNIYIEGSSQHTDAMMLENGKSNLTTTEIVPSRLVETRGFICYGGWGIAI
jgi:hypothetical protein